MDLSLCNDCDRHVKSDERACPFCGAARRPRISKAGLGAAVALGLGLAVAGCTEDAPPPGTDLGMATDLGPVDSGVEDGNIIALYGPAPIDAGEDSGGAVPLYGPAPSDAG